MVIRMQPQPVWPCPGPGSSSVSHLWTNHAVWLWLGPPIHFIHISGPLNTYKRCLVYLIRCGWSYGCHSILYGHCQDWAVCHIRELTTLLGCDWYLLFTSYTCQVHFIHIKGVFRALYAVDGHKDTTPTCMGRGQGQAVFHIWEPTTLFSCDWVLISTSYTC